VRCCYAARNAGVIQFLSSSTRSMIYNYMRENKLKPENFHIEGNTKQKFTLRYTFSWNANNLIIKMKYILFTYN